jgi:hypothetical protein
MEPDQGDSLDTTAGPRGRRLCWQLLHEHLSGPGWRAAQLDQPVDNALLVPELEAVMGAALSEDRRSPEFAERCYEAFADSVTWAMYWQAPDGVDRALATARIDAVLRPLAAALRVVPATQWWAAPIAMANQHVVAWLDPAGPEAAFTGAAARLDGWHAGMVADELAAQDYSDDPAAGPSAAWWSTPHEAGTPTTTRALETGEPVGVRLVEDELGWDRAVSTAVDVDPGARVCEVTGAGAWAELVNQYPLVMTRSRQPDWYRATGRSSTWLIPDFRAVSADYDGVHLTGMAYLTTAGRAVAVEGGHTLLAGWNPDQTWWLGDVLTPRASASREWIRDEDGWRESRV